jgi:phosphate transport system permease protein
MASILSNGLSSFNQTYIALDVYLDPAKLDKNGNRAPEDMQKITTFHDPAPDQDCHAGHAG